MAAKGTNEEVGKGALGEANGYAACAGWSLPVVVGKDGPSMVGNVDFIGLCYDSWFGMEVVGGMEEDTSMCPGSS